jgi:hypothetical protein
VGKINAELRLEPRDRHFFPNRGTRGHRVLHQLTWTGLNTLLAGGPQQPLRRNRDLPAVRQRVRLVGMPDRRRGGGARGA